MEGRARDSNAFFNVAWQTVDVRKVRKIVMKRVKLCKTPPIKRISKTFAYLTIKQIGLKKIAKLLSHSIGSLDDRAGQNVSIIILIGFLNILPHF